MPRLQTPCGEVELPEQTREVLERNAQEWSDLAGDAFVGGLTAMANGKLAEANTCFEEAKRCLSRVQVINAQALELAERAA